MARLVAALIALTIIGAPLIVDLCQVRCAHAESLASADTGATTHSCHETAAPTTSQQRVAALPHGCGHGNELPASSVFDTLASALHTAVAPSEAVGHLALAALPPLALEPLVAPAPPGLGGRAAVPLRL